MKKFFSLILFGLSVCLSASAQTQQTQTTIRVNCGGPAYADSKGQAWKADFGFNGGTAETISSPVNGTPDPALFQSYHWDPTSYSFSVPNGKYQLNLYFVEANAQAEIIGGRVFDVSVQGAVVFPKFDIFSEVGANTALIKTASVSVANGILVIGFKAEAGLDPKISAIEIVPANQVVAGPTLTLSFKYPDGTPVTGTLSYSVSSSLLSFQGTQALVNGFAECDLFANPSAMGISAQFQVTLSLTDAAGHTLWQLNLGMNPAQVNLGSVQSSALNVIVQKMS